MYFVNKRRRAMFRFTKVVFAFTAAMALNGCSQCSSPKTADTAPASGTVSAPPAAPPADATAATPADAAAVAPAPGADAAAPGTASGPTPAPAVEGGEKAPGAEH